MRFALRCDLRYIKFTDNTQSSISWWIFAGLKAIIFYTHKRYILACKHPPTVAKQYPRRWFAISPLTRTSWIQAGSLSVILWEFFFSTVPPRSHDLLGSVSLHFSSPYHSENYQLVFYFFKSSLALPCMLPFLTKNTGMIVVRAKWCTFFASKKSKFPRK